jgi:hypothetical protein
MNTVTCPVSNQTAWELVSAPIKGTHEFVCPFCGRFRITDRAMTAIRSLPNHEKGAALQSARDRSLRDGSMPIVTDADVFQYRMTTGR